LKETLRQKSNVEVLILKQSHDSNYTKTGNPIYDVVETESLEGSVGSSGSSLSQKIKEDYSMVQPEKDKSIIGFYNNSGSLSGGYEENMI